MNKELENLITYKSLINTLESKNYIVFRGQGGSKDYDLNIINVRSSNQIAGSFDDIGCLLWYYNGNWNLRSFAITTDPSDLSLIQMKHPLGVAIVKPQQVRSAYYLGYHKGRKDHPALKQKNPFVVVRDFNKDGILDFSIPIEYQYSSARPPYFVKSYQSARYGGQVIDYYKSGTNNVVYREHIVISGFNYHRASKWKILPKIGPYSEGCQVHQSNAEYTKVFIPILKESVKVWGNSFTFTLITEEELSNAN